MSHPSRLGDMLARLRAGERWVLALWLFLASLAFWLELFGTPPEYGMPVFAVMAGLVALVCGAAPGAAAALAGVASAWWFAMRTPGTGFVPSPGADVGLCLGVSALAVAAGAAARHWMLKSGG